MTLPDQLANFARRDWETYDGEETVRIALVGAGWFTREWALPGFQRARHTEPTVIVDTRSGRAETIAAEHDLQALTPAQFHDGVASKDYDAVYVCTPNARHVPYVESAAQAGNDILCEKPMEATTDRAETLVETASNAGVRLMVGYRMHTEPVIRRSKELIQSGYIGEVVQIHSNLSQRMLAELDGDADSQWRLDRELSGGGAMMDIGIYPLNTTRFLLEKDPRRVHATTNSVHEEFHEVEEQVAFHAMFPDDVPLLATANHDAYHDSFLRVTGTEGQLVIDPAYFERDDRGLQLRKDGERIDVDVPQVHQLEEEFAYFADRLLSGRDIYPDGEHALVDMRTIDAVYDSAESGRVVEVDT